MQQIELQPIKTAPKDKPVIALVRNWLYDFKYGKQKETAPVIASIYWFADEWQFWSGKHGVVSTTPCNPLGWLDIEVTSKSPLLFEGFNPCK